MRLFQRRWTHTYQQEPLVGVVRDDDGRDGLPAARRRLPLDRRRGFLVRKSPHLRRDESHPGERSDGSVLRRVIKSRIFASFRQIKMLL